MEIRGLFHSSEESGSPSPGVRLLKGPLTRHLSSQTRGPQCTTGAWGPWALPLDPVLDGVLSFKGLPG